MAMYLDYKWGHPKQDWTCEVRQFDDNNDNVKVRLRIPWIMWPVVKEEVGRENTIPGMEIYNRAVHAADSWALLLREKVDCEEFPRHEAMSCIIQMHETLLHTICTLPGEYQYLRLFYGFAADHVAKLSEVTGLDLGQVVTYEPDGRFRIEGFKGYRVRLR